MAETETNKPAAPQTKTAFILSFPKGTPAADVVAKGKASGVALTTGHVYAVRSAAKARRSKKSAAPKGAKAPAAAKAAPAKKSAAAKPAAPKKAQSAERSSPKKSFIASQPATMSAPEVVAAAKKAGLEVSLEYVYKARRKPGAAKTTSAAAPAATPAAKRKGGRPKGSKNKSKSASAPVAAVATTAASAASKSGTNAAKPARSADLEQGLARFVVQYGAHRVREVLADVEARFGSVFGIKSA
jgi:hypothetical protein